MSDSTPRAGHGLPARLVLIRDGRWPHQAGVCCWRHGVHAAFAAAGADVAEITWRPPATPQPRGANAAPRLLWLPGFLRRPLALAYRGSRALRSRVLRRRSAPAQPGPRVTLPGLGEPALVIAESIEAAKAAVAAGVPRQRVWALALPAERVSLGDQTGFAATVADAAERIGGFLTDSEPARDSVERAAVASRPRVELFPPLAVDRTCPEHADQSAPDQLLPPATAQLVHWRGLLDEPRTGVTAEVPYSFATARLLGAFARWAPSPLSTWGAATVPAPPAGAEPGGWTAAAQDRAARRVWETTAPSVAASARRPRAALLAGHDLRFASDLAQRLDLRSDLRVTVDDWRTLAHGTPHTEARLQQAESIFAEWARSSAIWYSRQKRPDQFLAVRLHRFELDAPYPRDIAIDNVDAVVYIAPLFGRRIRDELGWPVDKLVYIPNFLDVDWLDRPKLPEARFVVGIVGIEWSRKRFDLALDLLAMLRREDLRFTLVVRSTMPWQNKYAWADPQEREYAGRCFERIEQDPLLRDAVIFDEPGRDMGRWFRRVGYVLSTSDAEGCHTAVAEGMASAAVPIVRPWPGAGEVYDKEWVCSSTADAAAGVLASVDPAAWAERGARAQAEIRRTYDPVAVVDAWADLLHGDVAAARRYFAAYSGLPGQAVLPGPRRPSEPACRPA